VLKEEKMYVFRNKTLRVEIIWLHHDTLVIEYGGKWKTTKLVTRNYWWPGIMRDIEKYMKGHDMCQRIKNRTEELVEKLKLSEVLEKP